MPSGETIMAKVIYIYTPVVGLGHCNNMMVLLSCSTAKYVINV